MKRLSAAVVFVSAFVLFAWTLLERDPPNISESDQVFYHSIAYDLHRYGVFSNGIWGPAGHANQAPPAGMMYVPLYPAVIWAGMQVDARFAEAIACANQIRSDPSAPRHCVPYTRPLMLAHALFLALGILAISLAGFLIIPHRWAFPLTAVLATAGTFSHAGLFIYLMTEPLSFCLYSLTTLAFIAAMKKPGPLVFALTGVALGLLVLTRPAFLLLAALLPILMLWGPWRSQHRRRIIGHALILVACVELTLLPWQARNYWSVGKFGLSEEYGAVNVISRFGYNHMTLRDGLLAFPAALPQIGVSITRAVFGETERSGWGWGEDSLYGAGSRRVFELRQTYGSLDPILLRLVLEEMRENWWRYLLTTIPIAWTGLWIGKTWGLIFIPILFVSLVHATRRRQPMLLAYSIPALVMVVAHAALSNHSVRFNIGLIGPISVGAAYFFLCIVWQHFLSLNMQPRQGAST
jgi:hypothetical protein